MTKTPRCQVMSNSICKLSDVPWVSAGHRAAPQASSEARQEQRQRHRDRLPTVRPGGGRGRRLQRDQRLPSPAGLTLGTQAGPARPASAKPLLLHVRTSAEEPHPRQPANLAVNTGTRRETDLRPGHGEVWGHTKGMTRHSNRKKMNLITKCDVSRKVLGFLTPAPDTELPNASQFPG